MNFANFLLGAVHPTMITPMNHEQCIFILYDSAGRGRARSQQLSCKLDVNLYLNFLLFSFHMLSTWVKHQIINTNVQSLCYIFKNVMWYGQILQWTRNSNNPNGKQIFANSYKFSKFEIMEYLIHYV